MPLDYCLESKGHSSYEYLKLHGSINWFKCQNCHKLTVFSDFSHSLVIRAENRTTNYLDVSRFKDGGSCCSNRNVNALIIPPTWNKTDYYNDIFPVWKAATDALATAEHIIIIGYSLPESDMFFKYMCALGAEGKSRIKNICVIDPDNNVGERFAKIIGDNLKSRFEYASKSFEDSFPKLQTLLG